QSLREGLTLGLIVGTAIWLWLVIIDAVAGQPFRTFHVLGGILTFFMPRGPIRCSRSSRRPSKRSEFGTVAPGHRYQFGTNSSFPRSETTDEPLRAGPCRLCLPRNLLSVSCRPRPR